MICESDESLGDDEPLRAASDDDYDLAHAAYHLARLLAALTGSGQVVAVNAPWGSGKTSLVNLTEPFFVPEGKPGGIGSDVAALHRYRPRRCSEAEFMRNAAKWRTLEYTFVRFNAWIQAGEEGIALAIIDAVADAVADPGKAKSLGRRMLRYTLRNPGLIVKGAIAAFNVTSLAFDDQGKQTEASADLPGGASLEREVEKLQEKLEEERRHLMIVIDDIDRMPPERIQHLFVALWWVKELPRVSFLLLFDRDQVIDGLARTMFRSAYGADARNSASRFMEKIVQYSFDVPQPTRPQLLDALEDRLSKMPDVRLKWRASERFGLMSRWDAIRLHILRELVNTPRAVKRLCWTVRISWPMRSYIDIDFRDLVAIEAIRLFRPSLFDEIERDAARIEAGADDRVELAAEMHGLGLAKAILMPAHFHHQGSRHESASQIESRRGFGVPRLMSHYLQGVPQPGITALYNLEDFFHERSKDFQKTLHDAVLAGEHQALCTAIVARINDGTAFGRTGADLARALMDAAHALPKKQAEYALALRAHAELIAD